MRAWAVALQSAYLVFGAAGLVYVGAWVVQVGVGHALVEGNKPGMVEQLTVNSVVLSPLLAWDVELFCAS